MPAIVYPKITDAGLAAAVDADANEIQISITHIALGTGVYNSEATGAGMTAMAARVEHVALGAGSVSGAGGCRILAHFQAFAGAPYNATEIGFWIGEPGQPGSTLFAVFSTTTDTIVTRNSLDYIGSFTLQLVRVPPGSVTITVDPSATQALVLLALHEQASDPHNQYLLANGSRAATGAQVGLTAPPLDNSTKFATTAFVKRTGVSYPASGGVGVTGADVTVATADLGRWFDMQMNGGVLRMPLASSCPVGASIAVRVTALTGVIVAQSGNTLVSMRTGVVDSIQVAAGDWLVLSRNGATEWWVTQQGSQVPVGMVCYMPTTTPPPGFLPINGALLGRTGYPALLAYAQTSGLVTDSQWISGYFGRFSSGNGSTNFRIPDVRGLSLQGYDDGRGLDDPARPWGFFQASANKAHTHGLTDPGHTHNVNDNGHSHGGSASSVGDHGHSGAIEAGGAHGHTGSADSAGSHTHSDGIWTNLLRPPYAGSFTGADYTGGGSEQAVGAGDSRPLIAAGAHGHNLTIAAAAAHTHSMQLDPAGGHSHGVTVGNANAGIALFSANAGISMGSEGAQRARVDNLNWPAFIRYC